MNRRWETWGLLCAAIALLLNMIFDDSWLEYVAMAFALAALICAVGYLLSRRGRDTGNDTGT